MLRHVNIVEEGLIHDKAAEIALLTGCRAVNAYYIVTAEHVDAILITSDRTMRDNALRAGVEAYYLPTIETIRGSKRSSSSLQQSRSEI